MAKNKNNKLKNTSKNSSKNNSNQAKSSVKNTHAEVPDNAPSRSGPGGE